MVTREDMQKRLLATFREEAAEHLQVLTSEVESLMADPGGSAARQHLATLFRIMHTLKGAARSVRSTEIENICQENERFLQGVTRGNAPVDRAMVQALHVAIDKLRVLIGGLFRQDQPVIAAPAAPAGETRAPEIRDPEAAAPEPPVPVASVPIAPETGTKTAPSPAAATPVPPTSTEHAAEHVLQAHEGRATAIPPDRAAVERHWKTASVRVDIGRLDRLMQIAEDLLMPSLVSAERMRAARRLTEQLADLRGEMRRARFSPKSRQSAELPKEAEHAISDALAALEMQSRQLTVALTDDSKALRAVVDELLRETKRARMMPVATMFSAFPGMVKDLSHEVGKDVKLRLRETSVEIDRKVIELVKDPLIHLVRNAIDHGIEQPQEREAAGKPKRGKITISVRSIEGGWIVIEVKDDGRGMNIPALRDAVLRANLLSPAAIAALADEDVVNYVFSPGVSTKSVITSLSGLGLGLAIVREQIERVEGNAEIRSVPGQGTLFRLQIPASIVSYRGLLVSAGTQKMLWPAEAVERVIGVSRQDALAAARNGMLVHDGENFPFGDLGAVVFGQAPDRSRDSRVLIPGVLARSGTRSGILMVDEIHGEIEVLVKDLPPPLRRVKNISATGLLATGQLALILRPSDVLTTMHFDGSAAEPVLEQDETKPARILVVDDSITTRTMERNLFEASGYEVRVAADGLEAWNILQYDSVDLIVSDIDMPGLNGFDLTAKIRASDRLRDIPVVLVTALETREDKERGIRVGANAYVLKSSFEQSNLLQIVGRLI